MRIRQCITERAGELRSIRRDLHRIPETAYEEFKTSQYIVRRLEAMQPDSLEIYLGTGVKAVFLAPGAQTSVGVRADMDALPVTEQTGLAFASEHPGCMHACGHDGHMAAALVTAEIVSSARSRLKQNYVFLFQPAEETTGGAEPMIEAGVLSDPPVAELYGAHLWPFIPEGKLGLRSGPLMAGMRDADIVIRGRSCHGARPQDGSDAIIAAAQLITAVQTILSRNVDPEQTALLTIGSIRGGTARNIVCGEVLLEGTIRAYEPEVQALIEKRLQEILAGLEVMYDVGTQLKETMSYPPVINPEPLFERLVSRFDADDWLIPDRVMISEDFSFYQRAVPAFFAFLGTGSPKHSEPLHSSRFSFDEKVLEMGVEYFLRATGFPEDAL